MDPQTFSSVCEQVHFSTANVLWIIAPVLPYEILALVASYQPGSSVAPGPSATSVRPSD